MLSTNRGMSRFGKEPPAPAGGAPLYTENMDDQIKCDHVLISLLRVHCKQLINFC